MSLDDFTDKSLGLYSNTRTYMSLQLLISPKHPVMDKVIRIEDEKDLKKIERKIKRIQIVQK